MLAALLTSLCNCGEIVAGGGGIGGGGGGGGRGSATAGSGSSTSQGNTTSGEPEPDPAAADRAILDACGHERPCPPVHQQFYNHPEGDFPCFWEAMLRGGVRLEKTSTLDGCFDPVCEDEQTFLYVDDPSEAHHSSFFAPFLQRCTLQPASFFEACIEAHEAGVEVPDACDAFPQGWFQSCEEAVATCEG